jgi:hypothetical protein
VTIHLIDPNKPTVTACVTKVTLVEATERISGPIEVVKTVPSFYGLPAALLVNEEGRVRKLPHNPAASAMAGQPILGSAVLLIGQEALKGWTWEEVEPTSPEERRER